MRVGQWVLAVGSPFGLNQTVTHGIISARERGQVSLGNTIRIKDFLQTDAAINPGSSGGPLVNLDGEVIGINTAIASHSGSNSGVAFSIPDQPGQDASSNQLLDKGTVTRGYLGLQVAVVVRAGRRRQAGAGPGPGRAGRDASTPTRRPPRPACAPSDVVLEVDGMADPQREPLHQPDQRAAGGPAHPPAGVARPADDGARRRGRRLVGGAGAFQARQGQIGDWRRAGSVSDRRTPGELRENSGRTPVAHAPGSPPTTLLIFRPLAAEEEQEADQCAEDNEHDEQEGPEVITDPLHLDAYLSGDLRNNEGKWVRAALVSPRPKPLRRLMFPTSMSAGWIAPRLVGRGVDSHSVRREI